MVSLGPVPRIRAVDPVAHKEVPTLAEFMHSHALPPDAGPIGHHEDHCEEFAQALDAGFLMKTDAYETHPYAMTNGHTYYPITCCPFCVQHLGTRRRGGAHSAVAR